MPSAGRPSFSGSGCVSGSQREEEHEQLTDRGVLPADGGGAAAEARRGPRPVARGGRGVGSGRCLAARRRRHHGRERRRHLRAALLRGAQLPGEWPRPRDPDGRRGDRGRHAVSAHPLQPGRPAPGARRGAHPVRGARARRHGRRAGGRADALRLRVRRRRPVPRGHPQQGDHERHRRPRGRHRQRLARDRGGSARLRQPRRQLRLAHHLGDRERKPGGLDRAADGGLHGRAARAVPPARAPGAQAARGGERARAGRHHGGGRARLQPGGHACLGHGGHPEGAHGAACARRLPCGGRARRGGGGAPPPAPRRGRGEDRPHPLRAAGGRRPRQLGRARDRRAARARGGDGAAARARRGAGARPAPRGDLPRPSLGDRSGRGGAAGQRLHPLRPRRAADHHRAARCAPAAARHRARSAAPHGRRGGRAARALGGGPRAPRTTLRRDGGRGRGRRACGGGRRPPGPRARLRREPGAARRARRVGAGGGGAGSRGARRGGARRQADGRRRRRGRHRARGGAGARGGDAADRADRDHRRASGHGGGGQGSMSSEGRLVLVGGTEAADDGLRARAGQAIARATQYLVTTQHPHGYWHAPLEANVTMEAEYVFFNRMLGRERADLDRRMAERLLARQGADGRVPQYKEGPGNLSTTIEAYFALKLAGRRPEEPALARARDFILGHGGIARAGVFTRFWLAYFGQFPWAGLPGLPVELVLLPPWFPVNIYAMSSWARGTVVPLALLAAHRPRIATPPEAALNELWLKTPTRAELAFPRSRELITSKNFFLALDRAIKLVGQSPWKPFRRRAIARAIEWLVRHQDKNGQWGGIQPAMLHSVLALHAVGFAPEHPAMVSGIQGVDDFLVECEGTLMYQPCVSPTWDTALAMKALLESGMDPAHPMLARAAEWLVANQIFRPGDWSIRNPELEPGGWAFEFANDWFPDVDDSAVILMVLAELPIAATPAGKRAIAYGLNWTLGMQSRSGGWGAFDTDNTSEFLNRIPFADLEAMVDPPTEDVTGRLLSLMGARGYGPDFGRARRALEFVRRTQRPDGLWWGRWGVNFIYATWSVLDGLAAIGEDLRAPWVRRAVEWLRARQNADGGWGETVASYDDESLAGKGESTASQTAWALLGLMAADGIASPAVQRGIDYLVRTQGAEGTWCERLFTGTGFPRHFYLRYHLYRHYFPLMALGRYARLAGGEERR